MSQFINRFGVIPTPDPKLCSMASSLNLFTRPVSEDIARWSSEEIDNWSFEYRTVVVSKSFGGADVYYLIENRFIGEISRIFSNNTDALNKIIVSVPPSKGTYMTMNQFLNMAALRRMGT